MKAHLSLCIAAGLAALVGLITSVFPNVSRPVFSSYVIAVVCLIAAFDYSRGRAVHRYF